MEHTFSNVTEYTLGERFIYMCFKSPGQTPGNGSTNGWFSTMNVYRRVRLGISQARKGTHQQHMNFDAG